MTMKPVLYFTWCNSSQYFRYTLSDTGENFCLGGDDDQYLSISLCTHGIEEMDFVTEAIEH